MTSREKLATPTLIVYWLAIIGGLGLYAYLRSDDPWLTTPLWIAVIGGTVLGQVLALRDFRFWVIALLVVSLYVLCSPFATRPDEKLFWLAFGPAAICGALSLSYRGGLLAFWFPIVIWMLSILDRVAGQTVIYGSSVVMLGVIALGFIGFLYVRESRRSSMWQTFSPMKLAAVKAAVVLKQRPAARMGKLTWAVLLGWGMFAATAWLAPRLWQLESYKSTTQEAIVDSSSPGCRKFFNELEQDRSRVKEYFDLGRGKDAAQRRRMEREMIRKCSKRRQHAVPGSDTWYADDYYDRRYWTYGEPTYVPPPIDTYGYDYSHGSTYTGGNHYGTGGGGGGGGYSGTGGNTGGGGYSGESGYSNTYGPQATDTHDTVASTYVPPAEPQYHYEEHPTYTPPTYTPPQEYQPPTPSPSPHVRRPAPPKPSPSPSATPKPSPSATPSPSPSASPEPPKPPEVAAKPPEPSPAASPPIAAAPSAPAAVDVPAPAPETRADRGAPLVQMLLLVLGVAMALQLLILGIRPLRRFVTLRHLKKPFWDETVDQRISNFWQLVLIGLRDAGWQTTNGEAPRDFAQRTNVTGVEDCATILERARHGVGLDAADLGEMEKSAGAAYQASRKTASPFARFLAWFRRPLA